MTKKTWIVWALFLLLPGVVGLCIQFAQKRALQDRIDQASQRAEQDSAVGEYLQMLHLAAQLVQREIGHPCPESRDLSGDSR